MIYVYQPNHCTVNYKTMRNNLRYHITYITILSTLAQ